MNAHLSIIVAAVAGLALEDAGAWAQGLLPTRWSEVPFDSPRVEVPYGTLLQRDSASPATTAASKTPRLRMFAMPSGFLINPLGIEEDEADGPDSAGPSNVQVNVGMYNPNFDLRLPGDPGGVGYYALYSQLQILEEEATSVCLGLHAYTPAGPQAGGVPDGPTVVSPAIAWFQDLGSGSALQGYLGQNIRANTHLRDNIHTGFHYGMAVQYPLFSGGRPDQGLYLFVQGLGRYRCDSQANVNPLLWEVVPGVHLRWTSNCWMSVGVSHVNFLTCNWQF